MAATVPFMDLKAEHEQLGGELEVAVARAVASGWYLLGLELEAFEEEFADYCGTRHCVGVASGLSAIELTLRAAGIGPGDEVIVPAYTFIATWLAVSRTGARPVPVDVHESTYNLDAQRLSDAINSRTAAIVPVHLRGEPAEMDAIGEIARKRGLLLIEDAAQAHGAKYQGGRAGGIGDAGAFSFYPSKNLGALGDGGAITTDDAELATKARLLRNYGMRSRYEIEEAGVNSRLGEIQAAALRAKLPRLDERNALRARLAEGYRADLSGVEQLALPEPAPGTEAVWHLFVIGHPDRDSCARLLAEHGVETSVHYPVLPHRSDPYLEDGWREGSMPTAERLAASAISLPLYPTLSSDQQRAVVDAVVASVS